MAETDAPFVLLDDARPGGTARLFRNPVQVIETRDPEAVADALDQLRAASRSGLHAAGFLSYEAGYGLDAKLSPLRAQAAEGALPLLWFGLFETGQEIEQEEVPDLLPPPSSAWTGRPEPLIERADYEALVAQVQAHIAAGDIYQANLTFQTEVRTAGPAAAIYAALRERAGGGHGALLFTGTDWLLSFSPELFFSLDRDELTARPMKGTARRESDAAADERARSSLQADPKQRAENLMIVDLLRNDLARVSKAGSVAVPSLFEVETYPTVHQMTSTVRSRLDDDLGAVDALKALFPCGSITGAPKLRAMEIIHGLEERWRGAYTGSIGHVDPAGSARFNVAIRTLWLREGAAVARLGLGSGIVADSRPADEWQECLTKGAFVSDGSPHFDLVETMRFDPVDGLVELERHLERLKRSADALGFDFDRHGARNELQAATFRLREARKVRLLLSPGGATAIETSPLAATFSKPLQVALAPLPVPPGDFRLAHKTSDRSFYDATRRASGLDEILFVDPDGHLTEGSFTTLFVPAGETLLTPPLSRGLLPGILRETLIDSGRAVEADLRPEDLEGEFFLGNSLRGLIPARLAR